MAHRHRILQTAVGSSLFLAVLAGSGMSGAYAAGPGPAASGGSHRPPPGIGSAHVWITTPDGTDKMTDLGAVPFTATSSTSGTTPTVVVDRTRTFQTMTGFGASITDSSKWHARNLIIGATRNWAKTVVNWNIALDPAGGPHVGGCDGCTGVLTVKPDGSVTRNAEYYTLGHLARFVQPGAVRIASTSFGTTGWNGQVMDVAFRNPDGSTVLVGHNENDNPQTFALRDGDRTLTYTLPGGALATFVWNGDRQASSLRQVAPTGWTATAGPSGPCCTADVASHAADDDASTRYTSGAAQVPGQYLHVDMHSVQRLRQFVLDTGASVGDFPRGYSVATSTDGLSWNVAVANGVGSGQFTAVDLRGRAVRYVRTTLTASAPNWWTVADARAYRV